MRRERLRQKAVPCAGRDSLAVWHALAEVHLHQQHLLLARQRTVVRRQDGLRHRDRQNKKGGAPGRSHGSPARTQGSISGRSSAISPGPKRAAASPCSQAPAQAASKALICWASRPAIRPVSTSPAPAVARVGGALALIAALPPRFRDHRVAAFEQHHAAGAAGSCARGFDLARAFIQQSGKQALEFPVMGRKHASIMQAVEQRLRIVLERGERIGIQHHRRAAFQRHIHQFARLPAHAQARPQRDGVQPFVRQQLGQARARPRTA